METREFSERLRELREKAGLSQGELADKVGVNFTYLSKIESGVKPPPSEQVILRLAEVLDADRDELMTLAGKVPSDIAKILKNRDALQLLRSGHTQKRIRPANGKESFNIRLRELRKQAGLSQRELSDKIGVNFTYLSKIESGALPPPSEQVIHRLAKALNADKDELLTLAGKIPSDVVQMLKNREALQLLRSGHTQKKMKAATKEEGISMMRNLVNYKMLFRMAIPILLVCAVAATLWFTSPVPVRALTIEFSDLSSGTLGSTYTFTVIVTIEEATDVLPVHHIDLEIYNVDSPTYIARCSSLPIPGTGYATDSKSYSSAETGGGAVTASVASEYGWAWKSGTRYGYGYRDPEGMGEHKPLSGPWGYGYGYNSFQGETGITYTITWTSPSGWPEGAYRIKTLVYGDASLKFSGTSDSFTLEAAGLAPPGGQAIPRPAEPGVSDVSDVVTDEGVFTEDVTAESEDGKVELDIDEGTVGETAEGEPLSEITVTEMEDPPAPPEDAEVVDEEGNAVASYEDVTVIGLTYDLGPDGATFDPPITLTFTYDPDEVPEGDTLVIAIWDETVGEAGAWVTLETTVDPVTHTVTALVDHFTAFTILGYVPPEEEVPVAVEEIAELEASISELEAQVTALQADYDTATSNVAAAEALVASAQADYDTATSGVAVAQAQITSAQADYDTATSDITAAQAQVASAQSDLTKAQERVDELEAERGIAWWVWLIVGLAVVAIGVISWLVVRRQTA